MSTIYHVRKRPSADTLTLVHAHDTSTEPALPSGFERMTPAEHDAWVAAEKAAGWTPTVPQNPVPELITRRQFLKALLVNFGMTTADVEALIEQLPAGTVREFARIDFHNATEFRRNHETVIALATLAGKNAAQLDDLFRYGATLE